MALISVWAFHVKEGKEEEFKTWLADHEERLAEVAPKDHEYLGTYVPVWGYTGERICRQLWRYASGGPFDPRSAVKSSAPEYVRLIRELLDFVDSERESDEHFTLYRSLSEMQS